MKKLPVYAYYFPNWHVDKRNEEWHGKGWTEWECVRCARPRFEGHEQPRVPLWGYEDEADPKVMERKIDTAKAYGIDGFIFDTYCFDDGPYRQRCLDEGFLGANNNEKLEFCVMWCNHDSIYAHPSPRMIISPTLKSGKVTEEEFVKITDGFIAKYFTRPNYMRVDGKIFFILYNVDRLQRDFGGVRETRRIFEDLRARVRAAGLGELHLGCSTAEIQSVRGRDAVNKLLADLGVDEGVRYWWPVRHADDGRFTEYALTDEYADFIDAGIDTFARDEAFYDIPVNITVVNGLDQSPRTIQSETYENLERYPWYPVVIHRNTAEFERALKAAKAFAQRAEYKGHFITVTSWNEWTEGNYLEPDAKFGYGYLECIKKIFMEDANE